MKEVLDFCEGLLKHARLDLVPVADTHGESGICINITGEDRSYLLSNSGALLDSIEYLVNRIFTGNREKEGEGASGIEFDSDGYRKHRKLELELLARMASQKALASGKPLALQPMVPRERKIVHLALAEIAGVESRSEGSGENRGVTIYPAL